MELKIFEAGDYVRLKDTTYTAAEKTRRWRDIGAIGQVVYRDDQRHSLMVRFADRESDDRLEPGHTCISFSVDCWQLVDTDAMAAIEAQFPEPPAKERKHKRISPMDCEHRRRMFLSGSHGFGSHGSHRHDVTLCPDCGEFNVFGYKNGEKFDIEFTLNTDEAVEAAGKYLELLRLDDDERKKRD